MSAEASEPTPAITRWDLSDDDDYVDDVQSEEEEPENHLKEEVDRLIARIKELLKGDNFSLELKDVPRYVTRKNIEEFFEIEGPEHAEVEDPDPKNKRDVIVHFYNADDFCAALRKNGRTILSYTFDACYNPNIHHKLRTRGSLKHRDSDRYAHDHHPSYRRDSQRGDGDYRRDVNREQSGDVRKQKDDYDHRPRENRRGKNYGDGHHDRRAGNYRGERIHPTNSGGSNYTVMKSRASAPRMSEPKQHFEATNRYCFDDDEDEDCPVCWKNQANQKSSTFGGWLPPAPQPPTPAESGTGCKQPPSPARTSPPFPSARDRPCTQRAAALRRGERRGSTSPPHETDSPATHSLSSSSPGETPSRC